MPRSDAPFVMPAVHLGEIVLWRHTRYAVEPAPAIVTKVGKLAVSLLMFPTDARAGIPRDGVRHESDPDLNEIQSDSGVWGYTEGRKQAERLSDVMRELTERRGAQRTG